MNRILKNIILILTTGERIKFRWLVVLNVLISIADIAALAFLLLIIQFYIQPASLSLLDRLPSWLSDRNSIALIAIFLLLFSLKNFLGFLVHKAQYHFVYGVATRIAEKNLSLYLGGSFKDYINTDSSVFFRRIQQQPIEFCHHVLAGMQLIITQSALIILTVIAIVIFNAKLFLLLLLLLLPSVLGVSWLIKRKLKSVRINSKTSSEFSLQYLREALAAFVESNIYNREKFFSARYIKHQSVFNHHLASMQVIQGLPGRMIEVFAILGLVIVILLNKWIGNNTIDLITTGAFIGAAYKIIPGIVKIMNASSQVKAFEFTVLDLLPGQPGQQNNKKTEQPIQSIEFRNVFFSYKEQPVLENISFSLTKSDFAGIQGPSGIGKTTIIHLLLGFLDPERGSIFFNGVETDSNQRQAFWQNISYIKQQSFLIHDTILNNITLGDEQYDERLISEITQVTGLKDWVNSYPENIHYVISENGKDISGGQRQRIALARALYKKTGLIVLDEPFNELDKDSERKLLDHCKRLTSEGRIVILITHDSESLSYCNKIISLKQ